MERKRKLVIVVLAFATMTSATASAAEKRLSLNPYGSQLDNDASFILSGFHAPIVRGGGGFKSR